MSDPGLSLSSTLPLLNSKARIPTLGFGVYQISPGDTAIACLKALESGYRLIDTAQIYLNEAEVGAAIAESPLRREDIFVTTKIRYPRLGKGKTYQRLLESVQKIDPGDNGYVDLFLIHSPYTLKPKERKELWLAMEQLHKEGRAKAIGVSNYAVEHFEELKEYATVYPPAVNQILVCSQPLFVQHATRLTGAKLHPWKQQREVVSYCQKHNIVLQAFSPLVMGNKMQDPTIQSIATKYGKSPAQILIRYSLQKGWVPLPRSEREARIKENADVFDFELSEEDVSTLDGLEPQS